MDSSLMASHPFLPTSPSTLLPSPAFRPHCTSLTFPLHPSSLSLQYPPASRSRKISCHAGNASDSVSGGCCSGGGTEGGAGGSCGSRRKAADDLRNVGKEFEAMVSAATLQEFEKDYDSGEMQGPITREIMDDVMNTYPNTLGSNEGEKFLDIDALLSKAKSLSNGDFVFSADMDEMFV